MSLKTINQPTFYVLKELFGFISTFNNIGIISWLSDLLVDEAGVLAENLQTFCKSVKLLFDNVVLNTPLQAWESDVSGERSQLPWLQIILSGDPRGFFFQFSLDVFCLILQDCLSKNCSIC